MIRKSLYIHYGDIMTTQCIWLFIQYILYCQFSNPLKQGESTLKENGLEKPADCFNTIPCSYVLHTYKLYLKLLKAADLHTKVKKHQIEGCLHTLHCAYVIALSLIISLQKAFSSLVHMPH